MASQVEIDRTIEVQIDYVDCQDCGRDLAFSVTADGHGDLQITVESHNCEETE